MMLRLLIAAVAAALARGSCAPQKACDFLDRMHEQCIQCVNSPSGEKCRAVPGAPGCDPISLLCT